MYQESILSSKYQVVIPGKIRAMLNLRSGDRVRYHLENNKIVIEKAETIDDLRREISSYLNPDVKPIKNVKEYYTQAKLEEAK
ncbi:MAG: AbrB/MazE/SpoVT family DNA-binding domain-containing protein [Candidatus Nomurabacteria bacterium]|nr:AbrB/MazE/SpoVT family DNA-binding domain-containing protein [Candidatus Nomurabacteria bacterium]